MSDEINAGTGPNIVLRDHTGTAVGYEMPQRLRLDTSDGGATESVHESLMPQNAEESVKLDFSDGDMTVEPVDGTMFSKVTIPVPETLIPENIAEGVNIAGIIGALAAGSGGGGSLKIASGDFTATATSAVITHNLGVVPDIAGVFAKTPITGTNKIIYCYNFCAALHESYALNGFVLTTSVGASAASGSALDGTDPYGMGILAKANETTMRVGSSDMMTLYSSKKYHWFAIGGLT